LRSGTWNENDPAPSGIHGFISPPPTPLFCVCCYFYEICSPVIRRRGRGLRLPCLSVTLPRLPSSRTSCPLRAFPPPLFSRSPFYGRPFPRFASAAISGSATALVFARALYVGPLLFFDPALSAIRSACPQGVFRQSLDDSVNLADGVRSFSSRDSRPFRLFTLRRCSCPLLSGEPTGFGF